MAQNFNKHILLVDDSSMIRKSIRNILKQAGYENISEVDDGEKAWKFVKSQTVDLVISDWKMPVMTGLDLLKLIRGDEQTKHIPMMMLTAEALSTSYVDAVRAGVNAYLTKPFEPHQVLEKVQKILE
ncbi:MAG: response regulator [SAR324 cluster bacterium]|nr:response regulator [SAR324 cluster bacterium]